jgi:hypothetical protein
MARQLSKQVLPLRRRVIAIISLALVWVLLMLFANHPYAVERYYSEGFYPVISHVFHLVFNIFPFSIGDLVYIIVVIYLIYAVIKLIRMLIKKQWKPAGLFSLGLIIGIQAAVIIFYLFWGMNYYRPSAAKRLGIADSTYTLVELKNVTAMLIDSANACRARVSAAELHQDNKTIYATAITAIKALSDTSKNFPAYHPEIKPSLLTPVINYMGTSGYYNPFTAESQINYDMPVYLRPFVACHELSHQMGYAPEDEANFIGFLAGTKSKDRLLRYSAYYLGVQEFMIALHQQDSVARKELRKRISPLVLNDYKTERAYWLFYQGKAEVITSFFYDSFLKANNQPQGLRTYNQMIWLVMGWYRRNGVLH